MSAMSIALNARMYSRSNTFGTTCTCTQWASIACWHMAVRSHTARQRCCYRLLPACSWTLIMEKVSCAQNFLFILRALEAFKRAGCTDDTRNVWEGNGTLTCWEWYTPNFITNTIIGKLLSINYVAALAYSQSVLDVHAELAMKLTRQTIHM